MTERVSLLFPLDPAAIVLQRDSGVGGCWCIYKLPSCRLHLHFAYSVCGNREDAIWVYPKPSLLDDEALALCIEHITETIMRQIRDELNGSIKH